MSSVIIAATPLTGHTVPLLRVAAITAAAGHDVHFVGGSRFAAQAEAAGARVHPLTGKADYDDRAMHETFPDRLSSSAADPGSQLVWDHQHVFGDVIPDQHAALQEVLENEPEAVLITDNLFLGAWPAASGAGRRPRRWIALGIAPVYAPSQDTSPFGPVPVPPGGDQIAANHAANAAMDQMLAPAHTYNAEIIASLGGRLPEASYASLPYLLPDVVAQMTVPHFEFPRSDLPSNVEYVGILSPPTPPEWTPPTWWPEITSGRPVVLVTQGTLANADLSELIEPTLTALAHQDVLVVVALGRELGALTADVPDNARVAEWLPFPELLPLADVLVTNGGYGATQQSLASGTPVIVCGTSEDKPAVAARVSALGHGLDLATNRPSPDSIRDAVQTVLSDSAYRERTEVLAREYAEHDARAALLRLIEEAPPTAV